jgi:uncharacterized protein
MTALPSPMRMAAIALIGCLFATLAFAAPSFPPLTGRVVDDAGILSADTKAQIANISAAIESKTTDQLVVATVKSLQGYEIEDYGYQLGRSWGIGQKGKDNGLILLVAPNEKRVRIEVGYRLEGQITDAESKLIIENIMLPAFRKGDYNGGVLQGTVALTQLLGVVLPEGVAQTEAPDEDQGNGVGGVWIIFAFFIIWGIFGRSFWPLLFLGGMGMGGRRSGGFGGGDFGAGGFGGGGFSGGGGSFGGGGASGGW